MLLCLVPGVRLSLRAFARNEASWRERPHSEDMSTVPYFILWMLATRVWSCGIIWLLRLRPSSAPSVFSSRLMIATQSGLPEIKSEIMEAGTRSLLIEIHMAKKLSRAWEGTVGSRLSEGGQGWWRSGLSESVLLSSICNNTSLIPKLVTLFTHIWTVFRC